MENQAKQMKIVYTVIERSPGKSYWVKIGVGFVNHDGSINLKLDAIPTNGSIQIRDYDPASERRDSGARPAAENGRSRGAGPTREVVSSM